AEAVDRLFRDRELAMKVIGKWTRTQDRETLESSYEYATNFIERPPRLPYKAIETILAQAAETDPRARGRKADEFLDPSIYNELKRAVTSSRWANSSKHSESLVRSSKKHAHLTQAGRGF